MKNLPSSQTSVSILTASALLCRWSVLGPFVGCLKQLFWCCWCCIGFSMVAAKNGTNRTCESPMRPGVVSTASSRSIISDDDSDSDDFFKCWPWKNKITHELHDRLMGSRRFFLCVSIFAMLTKCTRQVGTTCDMIEVLTLHLFLICFSVVEIVEIANYHRNRKSNG